MRVILIEAADIEGQDPQQDKDGDLGENRREAQPNRRKAEQSDPIANIDAGGEDKDITYEKGDVPSLDVVAEEAEGTAHIPNNLLAASSGQPAASVKLAGSRQRAASNKQEAADCEPGYSLLGFLCAIAELLRSRNHRAKHLPDLVILGSKLSVHVSIYVATTQREV